MRAFNSSATALLLGICMGMAARPAAAAGPKGAVYQFTVPKQGKMYADANYYCWLPEAVGAVRVLIVHQHGCTREGDAQQMMGDVQWLTLAKKWHAAFIAPKLITGGPQDGSSKCDNWNDLNNGSGNAFLAAIDSLARRAGHPEIRTAPWALWGHSGGSMWITGMTGKYPERVAVGVAEACGTEISNVPAALGVPMLHHNGKLDLCYNDAYFGNGRKKGALWAHAVNPFPDWENVPPNFGQPMTVLGHAPQDLRMIAIPWIDICLAARLPEAGGSPLRAMDTSNAWLGDTATKTVGSAAAFVGNRLAASWLPDESFARKWAEYMKTGTLDDATPPPAPTGLTGAFSAGRINLRWNADADPETGIKTFAVYRNGALLATLTFNNASYFTKEKGFQRWQDGDQPTPSQAPEMAYTDAGVSDTGSYVYQVATVNWSGLAGPKSDGLALKRGQVTGIVPVLLARNRPRERVVFGGYDFRAWTADARRTEFAYDIRGQRLAEPPRRGKPPERASRP